MKLLDNLAINIANRVNAKNDEVMLLTQENEKLGYELNRLGEELRMSESERENLEEHNFGISENLKAQIMKNKELNSELTRIKKNYDELSKKKSSKESKEQITKLKQVNENQLKFIEILQVIASAKADKTQLKDVFSHNLRVYLDNNFNTMKQAENKLIGINRTTLSELKSGKTALSFDNLDILDSKMCEYFECSVYELVTVKMEGEEMRVYKVTLLVNKKVVTEEFESEDNISAYSKAKSMNGLFLQLELMPKNYKLQEASQ